MSYGETGEPEPDLLNRLRENLREALVLSIAFYLLVGVFILADIIIRVATDVQGLGLKLSYIAIALVPFIALLLVAGELEEIRGPGGISFLMQNEASTTVSPLTETTISVEPNTVLPKGAIGTGEPQAEEVEVAELAKRVQRTQPTTLSFQIGREDYYVEEAIDAYLNTNLTLNPSFRFILFTGLNNEFEGLVPIKEFVFMDRLRVQERVQEIETGEILDYPEVITERVKRDATNKEILQRMAQTDNEILAVVDDSEEFIGVVKQDEIVRGVISRMFQRSQS